MAANSESKGAVMVVEDDDDQRELLSVFLQSAGYPVYLARNGAEALSLLPSVPGLKLVLVDLHMPIMDGRTLIKRLRDDAAKCRLAIAVSDDLDPPSGIVEFFRKPAEYRQVLAVVRQHCGD